MDEAMAFEAAYHNGYRHGEQDAKDRIFNKISTLADIKVDSLKELSKDKVYLIGADVDNSDPELAAMYLRHVKTLCKEAGLNVIVYGMFGPSDHFVVHELEKGKSENAKV